jgi:hypothetical protein
LTAEYHLDGSIAEQAGDFLLLADASVRSTKLNLILANSIRAQVQLSDTDTESTVSYTTTNPFPEWQAGRDPRLVRALMLDGLYGSYLRLYAPSHSRLLDLRVDGQAAGAQQVDLELGKRVFARYVEVPPGETKTVEFRYRSEGVIEDLGDGWRRYRLHIQKEAGTDAIPVQLQFRLPDGSTLRSITLGGVTSGLSIETDLRVDRDIEIIYRPPAR